MEHLKTYELFNFGKKKPDGNLISSKVKEIVGDCFQDIKDEGFRVDVSYPQLLHIPTVDKRLRTINITIFKFEIYDPSYKMNFKMFNFSEIKNNVLQFYNMMSDYCDVKDIKSHMVDPDLKWKSLFKYFPMSKYGHIDPRYKDITSGKCDDMDLKSFRISIEVI